MNWSVRPEACACPRGISIESLLSGRPKWKTEACLVSVLCTAYNHEEYIRSALEGFVSQKTDFPFEVLINDDASTDKTAEIIREYEEKYPRHHPVLSIRRRTSSPKGIGYVYENVFYPQCPGQVPGLLRGGRLLDG